MKYNKNEVTGKMRDRIILQNVARSRSLTGFASESWADVATIWAFAESKLPGSNENIIDGKNTAKNVCDFTIRYISTISEESRVIWGDKLYQVKNIKVSHDRRFISFQGIFYDSYILTGVNVAAAVSGIATSTANIKLLMSVIGQANAIASAIGEITTAQQGVVEVASNVTALGTSEASITKVISLDGNLAGSAFVDATSTIVQYIATSINATASSVANALVSKTLNANVQGNATATSALDVISQGIASVDASVTATGTVTADILRIATLESSSNTTADTTANATLTKVLEASASATAQTSSDAQLTLAVNASATATANTSADAFLSYTVNAEATATAQTNADAFITRIISAQATATANSSAEAGIGVTFVAAAVASASVTSASVLRTATMAASVNGAATVNATLDVKEFILNKYPNAAAAYSLRKLRQAYTGNAIKVRRSSDNTEQDIGFDVNGNLDTSSLTSFCGAGNGFVTTWYDQSGNANNLTQTTQANQPRIVNSGSVESTNNKSSIKFIDYKDYFQFTSNLSSFNNTTIFSILAPSSYSGSSTNARYYDLYDGTYHIQFLRDDSSSRMHIKNTLWQSGLNATQFTTRNAPTSQFLATVIALSSSNDLYYNASLESKTSTTNVGSAGSIGTIGIRADLIDTTQFVGNYQEIIIYQVDKSSDRSNIENNINTYYGIY